MLSMLAVGFFLERLTIAISQKSAAVMCLRDVERWIAYQLPILDLCYYLFRHIFRHGQFKCLERWAKYCHATITGSNLMVTKARPLSLDRSNVNALQAVYSVRRPNLSFSIHTHPYSDVRLSSEDIAEPPLGSAINNEARISDDDWSANLCHACGVVAKDI
ncbi:hypothetical protein GGI35DRAFT_219663 [Trichoderma velutinum]